MSVEGSAPRGPTHSARVAYQQTIEQRRTVLQAQLTRILAGTSTFTWELGCGHGHFLAAYAQANPDKLCIGIDIVSERIQRAQRKRDRAQLPNLFFVHAEARLFLDVLPPDASFSELFILFPDPWPKVRHHKHRVLQRDFLARAATSATKLSRICFRTDHSAYFEDTRRALRSSPHWQLAEEEWPFEFCTVFQRRAAHYQSLIARRTAVRLP
jgi:tRNA (guanine-N7-)-methyltransferase